MTDKEKLLGLLEELGVPVNDGATTAIAANANAKVQGYKGSWVDFTFDDDGNFIRMGIWA